MENIQKSIAELEELAIIKVKDFLEKEKDEIDDKDIEIVKIATSTRGTNSRLSATRRVTDATQFSIIKTITEDPIERKAYIKATLPDYMPKK